MSTFPIIGTVSHGTLRSEDLIPAFLTALDTIKEWATFQPGADKPSAVARIGKLDDFIGAVERRIDAEPDYYGPDGSSDLDMEEIWEWLEAFAPDGFYFGAHPGDGSDFGFWEVDGDDC